MLFFEVLLQALQQVGERFVELIALYQDCLLYTS